MSEDLVHVTSEPDLSPNGQLHAAEWQPIETAPKGKSVIIAVTDPEHETIVGEAQWHDDDEGGGDWWWAGTNPSDYYSGPISELNYGKPTDWMPLPAPPQRSGDRPVSPHDEEAA